MKNLILYCLSIILFTLVLYWMGKSWILFIVFNSFVFEVYTQTDSLIIPYLRKKLDEYLWLIEYMIRSL